MLLKTRPLPQNISEALNRWPRLTAHLICHSLGYFTPEAAANALLDHKRGHPCFCEWFVHMAQSWDAGKVLEVGRKTILRAFQGRHHHYGYMAHYPQARALVEQVRRGGEGPVFASWF